MNPHPQPAHPLARRALIAALLLATPLALCAQSRSSSSSSSSSNSGAPQPPSSPSDQPGPRSAVEAAGSGTSLETNESLFDMAVALNVCGYDAGLDHSAPVRLAIRDELTRVIAASPAAQSAHARLCSFVLQHRLSDSAQNIAQYIYLALYTTPPPEMTLTLADTQILPSAAAVTGILPLIRAFADSVQLHLIWIEHRPEYESLLAQIHDPLTTMILDTNTFIRVPVSNYDGRRFVVLMEPMLSPGQAISLLYDVNYFVVASPQIAAQPGHPVTIALDDIRHTYLHYEVEPLIYGRASTLDPFLPLLRHEQKAPVDYSYKSDISALLTECIIKAIEIHMMDTGLTPPTRPTNPGDRAAFDRYTNQMNAYNRQAEAVRQAAVTRAVRAGWPVTQYFYDGLTELQHTSTSLEDGMGPMLFGMEVGSEANRESHIVFDSSTSSEVVRRAPPPALKGMDLAESKLLSDPDAAGQIASGVLKDPAGDHGRAEYLLGRLALMQGSPQEAVDHFTASIQAAKDTHTLAWDHIYLGRLYDIEATPERAKALDEYQTALNVHDPAPDTTAAAESGLKHPFALPRRNPQPAPNDDTLDPSLDPTGKAAKAAYNPNAPTQ